MDDSSDTQSDDIESIIKRKYVRMTEENKERMKEMMENGYNNEEIAQTLNVSKPMVTKYKRIFEEELKTISESTILSRKNKAKERANKIVECALADSSLSMHGIMNHLLERGIVTSIYAIKKALKLKMIRRELGSNLEVKRDSDFIRKSLQMFFEMISELDNSDLIYIGEKKLNLNDRIGLILTVSDPTDEQDANSNITISCLIAISHIGVIDWIFDDKTIDQQIFFSFIQNHILPLIKSTSIIFLGDLGKHYFGVEEFSKKHGCRIEGVPLYRKQLNPLNEYFQRLERLVKIHTTNTTTRDELKDIVNKILTDDKKLNMLAYYKHMREYVQHEIY